MIVNVRPYVALLVGLACVSCARVGRPPAKVAPGTNDCVGLPNGVFMPNPRGCQYFFYCHNGQSLEANCPGKLWFNMDAGTCAKPETVECTLNQQPEQLQPLPQPQPPPTIITESEAVECPTPDSAELTFLASKVDCGRYFICYHGRPRRQQCIADMHYNAATKRCDHPPNAKCPRKRDIPVCPNRGQVFYPHPEKCDYFIYCQNGQFSVQQCPFYHHWDLDTNSCRWRNMARCAIQQ